MSKSFKKLDLILDTSALKNKLVNNPQLFGTIDYRITPPNSPHRDSIDIWVRSNDLTHFEEIKDMSKFCDEHTSIWYPVVDYMTEVLELIQQVYCYVDGKELGAVFVTKLGPGGKIHPHIDYGWHAGYYDKFYVPVLNKEGSTFNFMDGVINPNEGEVYEFKNDNYHWVNNYTNSDRIALIICIKKGK